MFFNVNKETPTTQQETNPPMPAASSTVLLFSSSEEAAPLTTRTFRLAMLLDDDFACRFAEEEVKRKRVCDWEDEEIEDNAIRCIINFYIYIYTVQPVYTCARLFSLSHVAAVLYSPATRSTFDRSAPHPLKSLIRRSLPTPSTDCLPVNP